MIRLAIALLLAATACAEEPTDITCEGPDCTVQAGPGDFIAGAITVTDGCDRGECWLTLPGGWRYETETDGRIRLFDPTKTDTGDFPLGISGALEHGCGGAVEAWTMEEDGQHGAIVNRHCWAKIGNAEICWRRPGKLWQQVACDKHNTIKEQP